MPYEPLVATNIVLELLPRAIAIALTPFALVAVLLFLSAPRPLSRSIALLAGSVVAQLIVGVIGVWLVTGAPYSDEAATTPRWMLVGEMIAGLVLVVIGGRAVWIGFMRYGKPREGEQAVPRWLRAVDSVSPWLAFVFGVANMTVNLGNMLLTLGGAADIANAELETAAEIGALLVFIIISHVTVWLPIAAFAISPAGAEAGLNGARTWFAQNSAMVAGIVLLIIGVGLAQAGAGALKA